MTFTPIIVTRIDSNNSTSVTSTTAWSGVSTDTTGFNSIILTINSNKASNAGGIKIKFSDTSGGTFTTLFSDTYLTPNTTFTKSYPIVKGYWKIDYTTDTANFTITSRLSTDSLNSKFNTPNTFDNTFESAQDAFGKLRVSNPYTLLDLRFPGGTGNTGTTQFLQNDLQASYYAPTGTTGTYANSKLNIQISGNSGTFISQSRNYCTYQPGKSLLFLMSAIMDYGYVATGTNNTTGVVSKVGYFDNYNGLYFSYIANGLGGGTGYVNLLNNGVVSSDNSIGQAGWNIDKMDGSGPSGLTLNFTKAQLFVIDFEWLGVGRIRFGFYAYGRINYCHEITNINELNGVYMLCSNLPVRATLAGVTGTSSGNMAQICSTVISEGGYNPAGRPFAINSGSTGTTITTGGTEQILMMLSPGVNSGSNGNYSNQIILPTLVGVSTASSNDFFLFRVRVFRDTPVSSITPLSFTWSNVGPNSVCQYYQFAVTSGTLTSTNNSIIVDSNYCFGKGVNSLDSLQNIFSTTLFQLTTNASGTPDIFVLSVQNLGSGSIQAYGQIQWQEIY